MDLNKGDLQIMRLDEGSILVARGLLLLFQEVFGEENPVPPKEPYLEALLQHPNFNCFAAIYQNEVVGGLTAYELPMYHSESTEMFIYDIAVKPAFQRMGIGKELLSAVKDHCRQKGVREMFVDASEDDKHALDFYRSMPGREERVIQFSYTILS